MDKVFVSRIETGNVMRLGEVNKAFSHRHGAPARGAEAERVESRALVAPVPATRARQAPTDYRQAQFLAHLIAMKAQIPQTRERRRVEPGEAIAAYRAAAELTGR
jgi:hypothetical protein